MDSLRHHRLNLRRVGNVGRYHPYLSRFVPGLVPSLDFSGYELALLRGQLRDGYVGAFGGKGVDNGPTDVGPAAGYDYILSLQTKFHESASSEKLR